MRSLNIAIAAIVAVAVIGVPVAADDDGADDRILFVGSSFTSWGVSEHFEGLVAAADKPTRTSIDDSIILGAALQEHLPTAPDVIRGGDYTVVVLEGDFGWKEQSAEPFIDAARLLDEVVDESGGRTVFYMTWPYAGMDWIDLEGIVDVHRRIGDELGAPVAPVAVAMEDALAERPDLAMIGPDQEHQTDHGGYLAAATIFASVFDQSPEGLAYVPDWMKEDEAAFLQRVAWQAAQEWRSGHAPAE